MSEARFLVVKVNGQNSIRNKLTRGYLYLIRFSMILPHTIHVRERVPFFVMARSKREGV